MVEPTVASADTPTAWRIITRDQGGIWWLVVLLLSPIAGLLLWRVLSDVAGPYSSDRVLCKASVSAVFGVAVLAAFRLVVRVRRVRRVVRDGLRLKAEVVDATECGPGAVLASLEYSVGGKRFTTVSPPLLTSSLTSDQTLWVLVDPNRPQELFFPQLWS
jgi:hypothetical protein